MTAVSAKKVEGILHEINPTTIVVEKKMIYLKPEKREPFKQSGFTIGDEMRVIYDTKGNYINAELIKAAAEVPAQKTADVHMQQPKTADSDHPAGGGKKTEIHIQTETGAPQSSAAPATQYNPRTWIPEQEREDRIVLQSVLSRAVDIVNNHYMYFPSSLNKADFNGSLDTRINHIENTADRLFDYVTNKVEKEKGRVRK